MYTSPSDSIIKLLPLKYVAVFGVPSPATIPAFSFAESQLAYYNLKKQYGLPLILKGGRSASGFAMRIVETDDAFEAALDELRAYVEEEGYPVKGITPHNSIGMVVQHLLPDVCGSPGIAVIVGDTQTEHTLVGITEQCLDGYHHAGNVYPLGSYFTSDIRDQIMRSMQKAADEARRQGGSGMMLCADFIVSRRANRMIASLVEFNMRLSAQYGGLALSQALLGTTAPHDRSYFVGNVSLHHDRDVDEIFDALDGERLLYDREKKSGFIPLNLVIRGQLQGVLFAKNPEGLIDMRAQLRTL